MAPSAQAAMTMTPEQKAALNAVEEALTRLAQKQVEEQPPADDDDGNKKSQDELDLEAFLAGESHKVGLRFYRDPDGGKRKECSGTRGQKEAFRKAWAAS